MRTFFFFFFFFFFLLLLLFFFVFLFFLFCFVLFFFFFVFSFSLLKTTEICFGVYQNGNFLPGKIISRREKNQEKWFCPLRKISLLRPWFCNKLLNWSLNVNILLHICDTYNCDYLQHTTFCFYLIDFQLNTDFPYQFFFFYPDIT